MNLLSMSLSASILILIILITRKLFLNKLPKFTFPTLWLVVLIRLLVPYCLPSNLCLYNLLGQTSYQSIIDATYTQIALPIESLQMPFMENDSAAHSPFISLQFILIIAWLIGVGITSSIYVYNYKKSIKYFKEAIDYTDPYIEKWKASHPLKRNLSIRMCDAISSPLTYGIFSPVILLPMTLDFEDTETMKFVLEHEYQHIKHFDQLFKYVMIVATCIHWFNPLVHLMFFICTRDIEARCDEAVLYHFGIEHKKEYATTLVYLTEQQMIHQNLYHYFKTEPLEERILLIMKYKKFGTIKMLGSIALISVVSLGFATTVSAKMVKPNTPVKAQIEKTAQPITIGNNKLIALGNTPLMTNNTKVLYETTLIDSNLEKHFDLNNQDGQYLGVIIENYNNKYLPITITGDEYINKKGILDHKLQLNVPQTLSNPNDLYAGHIFTEIPEESMHYKIEVGNEDYICRNVEVKIVLFNE